MIEGNGPFGPTAFVRERRGTTYYELMEGALPATFAFQTRKGDLGILQVIRFTEEPRGMRIRYKLVQAPSLLPPQCRTKTRSRAPGRSSTQRPN